MNLEDRLRDSLVHRAERVHTPPSAWESLEREIESRSAYPSSTAATRLFALGLGVAAVALLLFALGGLRDGRTAVRIAATQSVPTVAGDVVLPSVPAEITAGEGYVWVSVPAQGSTMENSLVRIDPRTDAVKVITVPTELSSLSIGEGKVWGTGVDPRQGWSLYGIDPSSGNVVSTVAGFGGPIAVADGSVWTGVRTGVEGTSVSLARVDPATGAFEREFSIGGPISELGFDGTSLWVLAGSSGSDGSSEDIVKIDPGSNTIVGRVAIEGAIPTMAVGTNFVWVSRGGARPIRIDETTLARYTFSALPEGFVPFAADDTGVWFTGGRSGEFLLEHLDATTGGVDASIALTRPPVATVPPPLVLDLAGNSIWTANQDGSASQIDLGSFS